MTMVFSFTFRPASPRMASPGVWYPALSLPLKQELLALTATEAVVTDEALEDRGIVESVIDFAAEKLQGSCTHVTSAIGLGRVHDVGDRISHCLIKKKVE